MSQWRRLHVTVSLPRELPLCLYKDIAANLTPNTFFCMMVSDISNFPYELRTVLEECLSEEATGSNLARHLPRVRQIIANLLQGLRNKQPLYWNAVRVNSRDSSYTIA